MIGLTIDHRVPRDLNPPSELDRGRIELVVVLIAHTKRKRRGELQDPAARPTFFPGVVRVITVLDLPCERCRCAARHCRGDRKTLHPLHDASTARAHAAVALKGVILNIGQRLNGAWCVLRDTDGKKVLWRFALLAFVALVGRRCEIAGQEPGDIGCKVETWVLWFAIHHYAFKVAMRIKFPDAEPMC